MNNNPAVIIIDTGIFIPSISKTVFISEKGKDTRLGTYLYK